MNLRTNDLRGVRDFLSKKVTAVCLCAIIFEQLSEVGLY